MKPQPRPALKRAEDADLHPALSVEPTQLPTQLARENAAADAAKQSSGSKRGKSKGGKKFQSAGQATSDSLRARPGKPAKPEKLVSLDARVPKRVRKELKAIAKHSGSSVDAIVTQALTEWLGDPRRW
jgi:hypothetical protein